MRQKLTPTGHAINAHLRMVVILYPSALRLCTCFSVVASQPRAWGERCDYESNKSCRWRCYRTLAKLGTILLAILKSPTSLICSILRQIGRPLPAKIRMGYTGECPQQYDPDAKS